MKKTLSIFFSIAVVLILAVACKQQSNIPVGAYVLPENETFDVDTPPGHLVILDFNAEWCGPCKRFTPIFEKAAETYAGKVQFVEVDIDKHEDLQEKLNISSIPAVLFILPNGEKEWHVGFMEEAEFTKAIDNALAAK